MTIVYTLLVIGKLVTAQTVPEWKTLCPVDCECNVRPLYMHYAKDANLTKVIDCSSRQLKRIPRDLPVDSEAILLQNNSITMHVGIRQMPQLLMLDLSHNAIKGFFGRLSLPQLKHLNMAYNHIPGVSSSDNDFFAPLSNLETLSLRGNDILTVHPEALDLARLKMLDLSYNKLVKLHEHVFSKLPSLNYLDLSFNSINDPSLGMSFESIHLQTLNLSSNKLTIFKSKDLKVQTLDLSNNSFFSLSVNSLAGFQAERLSLSQSSSLWQITASAFSAVGTTKYLDFSSCANLSYIEDGVFKDSLDSTYINFDDTAIVKLPEEILQRKSLNISATNVPLNCPLNFVFVSSKNGTCLWKNRVITAALLSNLTQTEEWEKVPPTILPSFPSQIWVDLGSFLEIQCFSIGTHQNDVTWNRIDEKRKKEYPMPSFSGFLKLGPLYRVDSGKYVCRSQNAFGMASRGVQVNVTYAPVILIPIAVAQQYVTFAWNNSDPSIASQFRLTYFEDTGTEFAPIRTIFMDHLVRTYTIGNLNPATTYKICLYLNKSGIMEQLDCKNMTTKAQELSGHSFEAVQELLIAIGCISSLLFLIFMSTCLYRFYQDKQQDTMSESWSRILLSDTSAVNSGATTPITYFNPGVDPLTPATDMDVRAAFLPSNHPFRNVVPRVDTNGQDEYPTATTMF